MFSYWPEKLGCHGNLTLDCINQPHLHKLHNKGNFLFLECTQYSPPFHHCLSAALCLLCECAWWL